MTDLDIALGKALGNNSEIVKWGDGNYYKRFIMGPEHKLKNKVEKLESEIEKLENEIEEFKQKEIQRNCKEGIRVLKHIESLNGDYKEYVRHAEQDNIDILTSCCDMFLNGDYKCRKKERMAVELLSKPIRKEMEKISDPNVSTMEKHELLSNHQNANGIFMLLIGTVLPALISHLKDEISKYYFQN